MKVRIVSYEDTKAWILGKFALKMQTELTKLSIPADISFEPDPTADINHHIIYSAFNCKPNIVDTLMITHVDTVDKLQTLKKQMTVAGMGICMSRQTVEMLETSGIPASKLTYVSPAQDGIIKPRLLSIGIFNRTYPDGRKNENAICKLAEKISPLDFRFVIIGSGWDSVVEKLRALGYTVEYFTEFNYEIYADRMSQIDYYLYYNFDEGAMAYIDALQAGVKTVVTPQGYHLDAENGIVHSIDGSVGSMVSVFSSIAEERNKLRRSVADWTWENYTKKHVEIWQYLLGKRKVSDTGFKDGLGKFKTNPAFKKPSLAKGLLIRIRLFSGRVGINSLKERVSRKVKKLFKVR